MSGKAKRRDEAGASDADSEVHPPPKKISKKDSDDESDSIVVCEWNVLRTHVEEIDKAVSENS
ncbi:uncharacterized protein HKW66_Vig0080860 [Vigna angularis]|uniref:Uncharacterized protein n=1 Tax=Phaseolus angularis TaxID=3914 RepID=A0A8T0KK65_PHAAN|nr:uncharacterized protein HKW66_Vig0080860 [Vigna angularis]